MSPHAQGTRLKTIKISKTANVDQRNYLDLNKVTALERTSRDYNLYAFLVLFCSLFNSD